MFHWGGGKVQVLDLQSPRTDNRQDGAVQMELE